VGGAAPNLVLSEEQEELRDSLRRFLADRSPMSRVRQMIETPEGYDRALWDRMAADLSLQGMAVPDTCGGAGFGQVEMSIVMEELGRALLPSPFLASAVLATNALLALDDADAVRELLPSIAAGHTIATLAVAEEGGGWDASKIATTAVLDGDGWRLQGTKTSVVDGFAADLVVVVAHAGGELGFFIIDGDAPGLSRTRLAGLDLTRQLASLEFSGAPARRLVCEDATGALNQVLDVASVALAAEQLGGLQRCLEMSVDYAKARAQFGRSIGSFQAVKHLCADMHVAMELARSAVRYTAWAADAAPDELPVAAGLARAYCSEAFFKVAADTIQVHGGIGFTWEHDAHLYYRRAKSSELLLGGPVQVRERLAERLGV
jgi:alkylation response protein AidB-like acyl-CoA dehydrogenase